MAKKSTQISLTPLHDRVVVQPISESDESTSPSGIILAESAKEKPERGTVVAVGPGKFDDGERVPMSVQEGDEVLFGKFGYDTIKLDGQEYYILSESNILAVLNKK